MTVQSSICSVIELHSTLHCAVTSNHLEEILLYITYVGCRQKAVRLYGWLAERKVGTSSDGTGTEWHRELS